MKKSFLCTLAIIICVAASACTKTTAKLYKEAQLALENQQYDTAITLLKQVSAREPDNVRIHTLLGMGYKAKGELTEAISEYQKALDIKPNDPFTLCLLADLYLTQGRIDETITVAKKVIAINPESALAHYNLGIAYKKQDKKTIAAKYLFEAGLLALLENNKPIAVKAYSALETIGPAQTTQELYEILEPLLTADSKVINPSS